MSLSHKLLMKFSKKYRKMYKNNDKINILLPLLEEQIKETRCNEVISLLLHEEKDKNLQRYITKKFLTQIEIGIHSFCNRKCWFCPNCIYPRNKEKIEMPEELFLKILSNLKEIEYDGLISLYRYNESFADMPLMLKRLKQTREYLPNVYIFNSTNGDYIKSIEDIYKAFDAGLNETYIKIYLNKKDEWKQDFLHAKLKEFLDRIHFNIKDLIFKEFNDFNYTFYFIPKNYPNNKIYFQINNFNNTQITYDRGGSLDQFKTQERYKPCISPIHTLNIDYDGYAMPCCNVRYDIPSQQYLSMGNIKDKDIFEIFCSKESANIRKNLFFFGKKFSACATCNDCRMIDKYY